LRALRAGDVHQDSKIAELILKPFRFIRKPEPYQGVGIATETAL
jgi:hypothetical protein